MGSWLMMPVLTVAVLSQDHGDGLRQWEEVSAFRDCGVNCLVIACELLGKDTDKREMSVLARLGKHGVNFTNMAEAVNKKGLFCKGVKWELDQLPQWDGLAVAHWADHFVLVHGGGGTPDGVRVIDPPNMPVVMNAGDFRRKWDGNLLLISGEPITPWIGVRLRRMMGLLAAWGSVFVVVVVGTRLWRRHRGKRCSDTSHSSVPGHSAQ